MSDDDNSDSSNRDMAGQIWKNEVEGGDRRYKSKSSNKNSFEKPKYYAERSS